MKRFLTTYAIVLFAAAAGGQTPDPLADHGAAGLWTRLLRLESTASFLQVTAHPDDEDGGLLTMLSRGRGVRTGLVTLTRGEGGQNKIGPELFDELGITRTEELLAADRFYGIRQMFTRAVDYGYSKTLAEALEKWKFNLTDGGPVVGDLVRAIRQFRPEVFSARFNGTSRDGHAHHQASSILARMAFAEAGDPARFPEQLRDGLDPWSPKKMYIDNIREGEDWTVVEDVGAYSPLLGMSYRQLAWRGLAHQRTQGVGQFEPEAGPRPDYYKRIDGTPLVAIRDAAGDIAPPFSEGPSDRRESGFFAGLDETIPGIATRLGPDAGRMADLAPGLRELAGAARDAVAAFDAVDPSRCAPALARGLSVAARLSSELPQSAVPDGPRRREAQFLLDRKVEDFREALNAALSLDLKAFVEPESAPSSPYSGYRYAVETVRVAVPGESLPVSVTLVNRSAIPIRIRGAALLAPEGWAIEARSAPSGGPLAMNEASRSLFRVGVPPDAAPTAPFWRRGDHQAPLYEIDDPSQADKPLPDFPLRARVRYEVAGVENAIEATVETRRIDPLRGEVPRALAVEPALSLALAPELVIVPRSTLGKRSVRIQAKITNLSDSRRAGSVRLEVPPTWKASNPSAFDLSSEGADASLPLSFAPPADAPNGLYAVSARAREGGRDYSTDVEFIEHPDIAPFVFLKSARTRVRILDVDIPPLRIGYVRGAEDSIPAVLSELGLDVHLLDAEDLGKGDLSRYDTIITGPRAYDVREDLRRFNGRLLDYARNGGRLVVQYNSNTRAFEEGHEFPFPASFPKGDFRVTVEDSPVKILDPRNRVFRTPNRITEADFDGWVQERGLYFAGEWSADYAPLLEMHDPGESPLRGALLTAKLGRGTYVFTALSWFRELPEGVPGAIRLFVNLITPDAKAR